MRPFSPSSLLRAKPRSLHWVYEGAMSICLCSMRWVMVSISSKFVGWVGCDVCDGLVVVVSHCFGLNILVFIVSIGIWG